MCKREIECTKVLFNHYSYCVHKHAGSMPLLSMKNLLGLPRT